MPNKPAPSREQLVHSLYEAAELEHNLMCTYLYAAFSMKNGVAEGLNAEESEELVRWRRVILDVAIEEMGHLVAVWNITSALGAAPRIGRMNFPLDLGYLPAGVVVKLAAFSPQTLQHFIHLERPIGSDEPDGEGYAPERNFVRGAPGPRLTPMAVDYETVGEFYASLAQDMRSFVEEHGENIAFCGNPALQISSVDADLQGAKPVICLKTALAAFDAIVVQGEGAANANEQSHYQKFASIREEYKKLLEKNSAFIPAHFSATNPVLRRPPRPEGRVWIEDSDAVATVDLANACYGLMLRLLAYAYSVPTGEEKSLSISTGISLMRAMTILGERAARLPAGPANPHCNAGMSFTTLRDTSPLPPGAAAWRFFSERLQAFTQASAEIAKSDPQISSVTRMLAALSMSAERGADLHAQQNSQTSSLAPKPLAPTDTPETKIIDGIEIVEGKSLTLMFEAKRCIHARFCVTGAPTVFLANVEGPWIHPDTMDAERLADIAHACPSGAIRYKRKDGRPDETAPPVNLIAIREAGPYAVRGELLLNGKAAGTRATLCRCGASKNKPFCDGSHHEVNFNASGEPATGATDMLPVRDGPLHIDPQVDGPLKIRGNIEITSGTGRVVARLESTKLCRCGASANKPFCDGSHARIGFRSD